MTNHDANADSTIKHFLVAGVARNCGRSIRSDITKLAEALRNMGDVSWLIVESDSEDDTVSELFALASSVPDFRFLSLGTLDRTISLRTARIAHCRNVYLEELHSQPQYKDITYVVIADLDGMSELISPEGFASCWKRSDWAVCTANQRGPYYDIWALRHPLWSPNDCWKHYSFLLEQKVPKALALVAAKYSRMIRIPEHAPWIEVESAFGGLAIYRRSALMGSTYVGVDETGMQICEHVALHRQVIGKGLRIFINPRLLNFSRIRHNSRRYFVLDLVRAAISDSVAFLSQRKSP